MKKKFVAMLLVLATLLTLLPVTAMAADCNHSSNQKRYTSNNNNTHKIYCNSCRRTVEESAACTGANSYSTTCQYCKATLCRHTSKTTAPNGDGTHTTKCNSCGTETAKGNCSYNTSGKCRTCGGGRPCDHTLTIHTSNKNNTHNSSCVCGQETAESVNCTFSGDRCTVCKDRRYCDHTLEDPVSDGKGYHSSSCDCGKESTEPVKCTFGDNDRCTVCNGENPCKHTPGDPNPDGNGNHTSTCACGKVSVTDDCTIGDDGICTVCEGACAHANTTLKSNGIWNHSNYCDDCKVAVSTTNHYYNFFTHLCNCGDADPLFQMICQHNHHHLENNGINHKVVCDSCHDVRYYEPHGYNASGVCSCGAIEPECQHEYKTIVNNGANHSTVCYKCGHPFSTEPHSYNVYDMCTCGAVNPNVAPEVPEEPAPSYPADAWDHLDELFTTHK